MGIVAGSIGLVLGVGLGLLAGWIMEYLRQKSLKDNPRVTWEDYERYQVYTKKQKEAVKSYAEKSYSPPFPEPTTAIDPITGLVLYAAITDDREEDPAEAQETAPAADPASEPHDSGSNDHGGSDYSSHDSSSYDSGFYDSGSSDMDSGFSE